MSPTRETGFFGVLGMSSGSVLPAVAASGNTSSNEKMSRSFSPESASGRRSVSQDVSSDVRLSMTRMKALSSLYLRRLVRKALDDEFPDEELDEAPAAEPPAAPVDELQPDPNKPPLAGWTPRQLDQGWGRRGGRRSR